MKWSESPGSGCYQRFSPTQRPLADLKVLQKLHNSSMCGTMQDLTPAAGQMQGEAPSLQQMNPPLLFKHFWGCAILTEDPGAVVRPLPTPSQDSPCIVWAGLCLPSQRRERVDAWKLRPRGWRHHADPCVLCLYPTGCSKMWDNLTCWPATPRGQVVVLACPFNLSPIQGKSLA